MGWMNSRFSLEDLGRNRGELYKHEYQSDIMGYLGYGPDMGCTIWSTNSGCDSHPPVDRSDFAFRLERHPGCHEVSFLEG
jgi:hypothetical protein